MNAKAELEVEVTASMPQRHNGEQKGSGDPFWMSSGDADDAVAVRMVRKTGKTRPVAGAQQRAGTYGTRNMQPAAPEPSEKAPGDASADAASAAASTVTATPSEGNATPQKPYPHRSMNARR